MRMRVFGPCAASIMLALLWIQPAKADTFEATGSTDAALCANLPPGACTNLSYDLLITTGPLVIDQPGAFVTDEGYTITGISGEIGGEPVSNGPNVTATSIGALYISLGATLFDDPVPDVISFVVNGGQGSFRGAPADIVVPPSAEPVDFSHIARIDESSGTFAWVTWNAVSNPVSAPEPSALLQTGAGLLLSFAAIVFWRKQPFGAART